MIFDWLFRKRRAMGFVPQDKDKRDYIYSETFPVLEPAEEYVDLRSGCGPIEHQGSYNSCTAFAVMGLVEFLMRKHGYIDKDYNLSKMFNWYQGKSLHGWETTNQGVWLRNSLKAVYDKGFIYERNYPYTKTNAYKEPSESILKTAEVAKMLMKHTSYYLLNPTLEELKSCLKDGYPISYGMNLNKSFINSTGPITNEAPTSGGHALQIYGFINDKFIIRNSWGTSWKDYGYGYAPIDYVLKYGRDFMTIRENEQWAKND